MNTDALRHLHTRLARPDWRFTCGACATVSPSHVGEPLEMVIAKLIKAGWGTVGVTFGRQRSYGEPRCGACFKGAA